MMNLKQYGSSTQPLQKVETTTFKTVIEELDPHRMLWTPGGTDEHGNLKADYMQLFYNDGGEEKRYYVRVSNKISFTGATAEEKFLEIYDGANSTVIFVSRKDKAGNDLARPVLTAAPIGSINSVEVGAGLLGLKGNKAASAVAV